MPLQKRRLGRARIHHRRSSWARRARRKPAVLLCSNCGASRIPHRVCLSCGFYRDKIVMDTGRDSDEE
jgi:large subunit ribosomal protein L32